MPCKRRAFLLHKISVLFIKLYKNKGVFYVGTIKKRSKTNFMGDGSFFSADRLVNSYIFGGGVHIQNIWKSYQNYHSSDKVFVYIFCDNGYSPSK